MISLSASRARWTAVQAMYAASPSATSGSNSRSFVMATAARPAMTAIAWTTFVCRGGDGGGGHGGGDALPLAGPVGVVLVRGPDRHPDADQGGRTADKVRRAVDGV